ncbi:Acyl-protein thioesterase 1 [Smittium mucronatum]|uniref:Acyl-protein thioesterase 1 n=1 Tax=Smittium mucronatum TaxID=133383 RepID=A0A1R0GZI8_9FUNG|nr:Acyl-protein thioesterase 1 [Smittium mucronatum]
MLKHVKVNALKKHTASVIFLHGLGDSGHGWASVAEQLGPLLPHIRFIFPHAPEIPVTLNFGMAMPAWYDIFSLSDFEKQDEKGLFQSADKIFELVESEMNQGIPSDRIVIGGFSQGAAISYLAGLTCKHKLGGIAALSGYLPLHTKLLSMGDSVLSPNKHVRIFAAHGTADPVVRYELGELSVKELQRFGYSVQFCSYPGMEHSSSAQEIKDFSNYLSAVLPQI